MEFHRYHQIRGAWSWRQPPILADILQVVTLELIEGRDMPRSPSELVALLL